MYKSCGGRLAFVTANNYSFPDGKFTHFSERIARAALECCCGGGFSKVYRYREKCKRVHLRI